MSYCFVKAVPDAGIILLSAKKFPNPPSLSRDDGRNSSETTLGSSSEVCLPGARVYRTRDCSQTDWIRLSAPAGFRAQKLPLRAPGDSKVGAHPFRGSDPPLKLPSLHLRDNCEVWCHRDPVWLRNAAEMFNPLTAAMR